MALAQGTTRKSVGSVVNHIVNGASLTHTSFSTSADVDAAFTNADGYLYVDVIVTFTKAAGGTGNLPINIYKRVLDLVSTNDAVLPSANLKAIYVGNVLADNTTNEQWAILENVYVGGRPCEFYIENQTGQTLNNTWDLDLLPHSPGVQMT